MSPAQYNELQRQADVIEENKKRMQATPDPKSCVDQYKAMAPTPTPAVTPNHNSDKAWDNRWYQQSKEHQEQQLNRAMLWPQLPQEWSDVLHAYYKSKQEDQLDKSGYAPSADDSVKIKDAITILERVSRAQSSASEKDSIQKVINQLNTDLMYLKIKNNG